MRGGVGFRGRVVGFPGGGEAPMPPDVGIGAWPPGGWGDRVFGPAWTFPRGPEWRNWGRPFGLTIAKFPPGLGDSGARMGGGRGLAGGGRRRFSGPSSWFPMGAGRRPFLPRLGPARSPREVGAIEFFRQLGRLPGAKIAKLGPPLWRRYRKNCSGVRDPGARMVLVGGGGGGGGASVFAAA